MAWLPLALPLWVGTAWAGSIDLAGAIYAQPGKLKAKIQKVGGFKGEAPFSVIEYGPREGVPEGGFRLSIDDGSGALPLLGSYAYDGKKLALTLDVSSFVSELEDLIEIAGELPPDSVSVACDTKARGKVKLKRGVATAVTRVKVSCLASVAGFPETLKFKLAFKGKGNEL